MAGLAIKIIGNDTLRADHKLFGQRLEFSGKARIPSRSFYHLEFCTVLWTGAISNGYTTRRIFSRFDKLASRYLGFLQFAAVLIWLR